MRRSSYAINRDRIESWRQLYAGEEVEPRAVELIKSSFFTHILDLQERHLPTIFTEEEVWDFAKQARVEQFF